MRFLLVDAILEIEPGRNATGIKNVTMSEDFLADHFPHRPIMPGMLIIESLVQLSDWVIRYGTDFDRLGLACAFDRVKFRRVVRPGDQLRLEVQVVDQDGAEVQTQGRAYCLDTLVVSAGITLALHPVSDYLDRDEARRLFHILCVDHLAGKTR
jgi:3-hydroxyacyl-[acyl-carrier-protein] dehydratase